MRKFAVVGLVAVVAVSVLIVLIPASEPVYRGRTLTSWLEQCSHSSLVETQRLFEAQEAIRAIGPEKALPKLFTLIEAKDGPLSAWIISTSEKFDSRFFHVRPAVELHVDGVAGFEALGSNAAPAVPHLTELLGDKELAFVAVRCFETIGKPAESALCQCLTNENWQVRCLSVWALASVTDDVEVYIARIKDRLTDVQPGVRFAAVQAIGAQNNAPELAIPLLITTLQDRDDGMASQAAEALAAFGTNAICAVPALTSLVNTGRQNQTRAAMKTLAAIAPIEALPILSNAVVNGSSSNIGVALRSLKLIAPELSLQMTLAEFRSTEAIRRSQAVGVAAAAYELETPGIGDALRVAATDPDLKVAERATMTMRHMVQKRKDNSNTVVRLPNDPSYQNRSLGEWLRVRDSSGGLSTNAVEALRRMGTNVVPALLARVAYKDPVFHLYDSDVSMEAVIALIALREEAKPALPGLAALMDSKDQDLAMRAMLASIGTGVEAVPCLMKGLTNRFPEVRAEAVNTLTSEWSAPFRDQCQQAIPFLVILLSDPDPSVRLNAAKGLKEIDPQAAAKAGVR